MMNKYVSFLTQAEMNQLFDIYRKAQVNAEGYITDDALVQAFDAAPVD